MKTILLLGGYGFIGTNVLKCIDKQYSDQYDVIVFDKVDHHFHNVSFNCVKKVYSGDFSDILTVDNIFAENSIDLVFHFLSSTVPATSSNARYDVESNLVSTLNLLSVMDKYNVKNIVYLSSGGAIYGDYLEKVHNEEDAVYPKSSYGVVKLAIEKYLLSYAELYGFHSLILRLSNPFGPYHYNEKQGIINIAIRRALSNKTLQIWGDGNGIKDYIFINDVCDILFKMVEDEIETGVYNVASGNALSVNDIVDAIRKYIPHFMVEYVNASVVDVQSFELDITKLRKKLGGFKMTPIDDALKQTIEWQKRESNPSD